MTLTLLLTLASLSAFAAEPNVFGDAPTLSKPAALADVLANPGSFAGKPVLLEGTVGKVCRKKGCWMTLTQGDKDIRITFKDYGFFVPKDCIGKNARAQGEVSETTLSVREARHFLKDEGAPKEEIKKVKAPLKTVAFVATGVRFVD